MVASLWSSVCPGEAGDGSGLGGGAVAVEGVGEGATDGCGVDAELGRDLAAVDDEGFGELVLHLDEFTQGRVGDPLSGGVRGWCPRREGRPRPLRAGCAGTARW